MQWTALVKLHLPRSTNAQDANAPDASAPDATNEAAHCHWNACRLVLASTQIMYYAIHGAGVDDHEWTAMVQRGLIGRVEARALQAYPGNQPWLALVWAVSEVDAQLTASMHMERADVATRMRYGKVLERFRKLAEQMRAHFGQIVNGRHMLVPFPYFHLLNILIVFNLIMISYATVTLSAWPIALLATLFCSCTVLGMRAVAIMLSDPFGKDKEDFDLEPLMRAAYEETVAQLRMAPHTPMLNTLPQGIPQGSSSKLHDGLILDPTTVTTGAQHKWTPADKTAVEAAVEGVATIRRSITAAQLWKAQAQQGPCRSKPRGRVSKAIARAVALTKPVSAERVGPPTNNPARSAPTIEEGDARQHEDSAPAQSPAQSQTVVVSYSAED